jgi:ubiquinone/menaquinone biosynthesis C-methylase UbiE
MGETGTNWQVWQKPEIAARFTERRRGGMLGGEAQLDTMLRLLKYVDAPQLSVLDLGCGDGILLQTVMSAYPVSHGVALDGSCSMLEKAEVRFQGLGLFSDLVEYVETDFNAPDWVETLTVRQFDAVVSGFAIHHSEDDRKRALYEEIYRLLNPGGVFINIEHVASATPLGGELFETAYAENLARYRISLGEDTDLDAVMDEIRTRPDKAANRLAPLETQLGWLREIGFMDVDCYWKHYELAILAGYKSGRCEMGS